MLKQVHKAFCVVVVAFVMAFNLSAFVKADNVAKQNNSYEQVYVQKDIKVNDLDIEPINTQEVKNTVVPNVKSEGKKVMQNFLKAMLIVFFASIVVYFVLLFVKKYYGSAFVTQDDEEYFEALDLETPDNRPEALKSFLNRTK